MKCPICRKPVSWEGNASRPFCSERCRMIDLGNWINGKYNVPVEESEPDEGSEQESSAET